MTEMQIRTVMETGKEPDYTKTAGALLKRCREFYQDPENMRAFEEWKAERSGKNEKAAV